MNIDPTVFVIEGREASEGRAALTIQSQGFDVQTFSTCERLLGSVGPGASGCVVVEGAAQAGSGMELPKTLSARGQELPVIFILDDGDLETAVEAMKKGAADVINWPVAADILLDTVRTALAMNRQRSESERAASTIRRRVARLTPREREVMGLVATGLPNKSIARRLGIGHRTVEVHRAHLMEKLQADSSAELILMALLARGISASLHDWFTAEFGVDRRRQPMDCIHPAE